MCPTSFYNQPLINDYLFTKDEAAYAIKNARIDWNLSAQAFAQTYRYMQEDKGEACTADGIRTYLMTQFHYTEEQANFAITYFDADDADLPRAFDPITDYEHFPAKDGSPNALAVKKATELMASDPELTAYGIIQKLEASFTDTQIQYVLRLGGIDWEAYAVSQLKDEFAFYSNYTQEDVNNCLRNFGYDFLDAETIYSMLKSGSASDFNNGQSAGTGTGVTVPDEAETTGNLVWVPTNGGTKYHSYSGCSNMIDPIQVSKETAIANGYTACGRCY